jgi:hypothetical protein
MAGTSTSCELLVEVVVDADTDIRKMRRLLGDKTLCKYNPVSWNMKNIQTYLLVILEANLANSHTSVLLQIAPWRVDDCDVVLLVSYPAIRLYVPEMPNEFP